MVSSQSSSVILHRPALPPISTTPSSNSTPTNTPALTTNTTAIKLQPQNTQCFDITPTHFAQPLHPHISDPCDIDPILLRSINKSQSRKSLLVTTSIKGRRRHSRFKPSLPLPKPCIRSQPETSLPSPKTLRILALESFYTLSEKLPLSDIDSTTFSFIYPRLPPSTSASKDTTSSLDNLSETSSEFTFRRPPRHRYNLRYNQNPSLASTNSSLVRHHAQYLSSDSLPSLEKIPTSVVDTAFSQLSSLSSYNQTGHLFSRPTSENPSVLLTVPYLLTILLFLILVNTPNFHILQLIN